MMDFFTFVNYYVQSTTHIDFYHVYHSMTDHLSRGVPQQQNETEKFCFEQKKWSELLRRLSGATKDEKRVIYSYIYS